MDIIWITCLLCTSTELILALPTDGQQSLPLLDHLQSVVNRIQQPKPVVSPGVNRIKKMQVDVPAEDPTLYQARLKSWDAQWDPVPETPGLTNVCETFCPKFCRKQSPNSQNNVQRDCHFACTNLCDKKMRNSNPFIGNPNYDVVYSDFNFDLHDLNKDKFITKREFAHSERVRQGDVDHVFSFVDVNGDGYIDRREYQGGPLLFTVQMAAELSAMSNPSPTPNHTEKQAQ